MTKSMDLIILIFNHRINNHKKLINKTNHLEIRPKRLKLIQVQNKPPSNNLTNNPSQKPTFKPPMPFFPPPPPGSQMKTGGAWIPPPPTSQSYKQNFNKNQHHSNNYQKSYGQNKNQDANRDKKTIVYVKNIPKSYSTQQKLMTFFKNEGVIKQIKVNDVQQSAVIKFLKEQNAAKFLKSNKIIFNRSYIVYGDRQNITVTQQQINDRINDQQGILKKAQQTNIKVLKQKVSNQISQQIRAIYFLENYLIDNQDPQTIALKQQILKEKQMKIATKKNLQTQNDQKFSKQDYEQNPYDWTLIFNRKAPIIQRKSLFAQFLKYGPIISLEYECVSQKKNELEVEKKEGQQPAVIMNDYKIKILYLGIKNAWTLFNSKKEEMHLIVKGDQIKKYFDSGKLRTIQIKRQPDTEKPTHYSKTQSVQASEGKEENQGKLDDAADKQVKPIQEQEEVEQKEEENGNPNNDEDKNQGGDTVQNANLDKQNPI